MKELKRWILTLGFLFAAGVVHGAEKSSPSSAPALSPPPRPCELPEGKQFDFWIGEWEAHWPGGQAGTPVGQTGKGSNHVTKILSDCIVQENFSNPATQYFGQSVSSYNPNTGEWNQTWVDSSGGYLLFSGKFENGRMELRGQERHSADGKTSVSRMVYKNITPESFDWDWQNSEDGGKSWKDVWNIHYTRRK